MRRGHGTVRANREEVQIGESHACGSHGGGHEGMEGLR